MRFSQWKLQNYGARLAETPEELATLLQPMVGAGVDVFHCSKRRFWECEFGSDLNLAGWTKKLTGLPTIGVGSVSLDQDFMTTLGQSSDVAGIDELIEMMARGDFDMIAIGRALIVDADWATKIREGNFEGIARYSPEALNTLV
jgi:2,4-dienoyl-CoA reductase-like NADH-dependent reductase (Old Yellow Enzyme family)